MKNKALAIILFVLFITHPIYANTSYQIILNGINYTPHYPMYEINKELYVSMEDFISLTYSSVTSQNDTYTLNIQSDTIKFSPNEKIISINQKPIIVVNKPLLLKEQVYIPIDLLDSVKYPYRINKEQSCLILDSIPPYSRTTDSYKDHLLVDTAKEDLSITLKSLLSEDKAFAILANAKKNSSYISFIDNTDKDDLLQLISSHALNNKPMQVKFRVVDLLSSQVKVSALKELPLKVTIDNNKLIAEVGKDTIAYNCIWAAYKPDDKDLKIDVPKSLDATLMRILYEYYRDQYDLKDDLYFSPVSTIKTGRTESTHYTTYYDSMLNQKNIFDIVVYRANNDAYIIYTVDFILHRR